ncbi:hypothetical protein DSO57_1007108 [Entomophthora muscae]|uniref:Uncharacterized protein n=1 Tax=Entomophthora muscae TaxID=34485 RepID=A0ACC2TW08_9FUNG|nr:hypothetical protein DSO57_1007108 [Entomophthora muscae]
MPSFPDLRKRDLVPLCAPVSSPPIPTCTLWLLTGLVLMGLNAYFPQLSLCPPCGPPFEQLSQSSTGLHPGVPMTPPPTLQPNHPQEFAAANNTTSTHMFGVLYITLSGLVDSMVTNTGLLSFPGQSLYFVINLTPILWQALPSGLAVTQPAFNSTPSTIDILIRLAFKLIRYYSVPAVMVLINYSAFSV